MSDDRANLYIIFDLAQATVNRSSKYLPAVSVHYVAIIIMNQLQMPASVMGDQMGSHYFLMNASHCMV